MNIPLAMGALAQHNVAQNLRPVLRHQVELMSGARFRNDIAMEAFKRRLLFSVLALTDN